jgi:hypothetical protein
MLSRKKKLNTENAIMHKKNRVMLMEFDRLHHCAVLVP